MLMVVLHVSIQSNVCFFPAPVESDCGSPPDPDTNGQANLSNTTFPHPVNDNVVYTCNDGYIRRGEPTLACAGTTWDPTSPPVCNPATCPDITLNNGKLTFNPTSQDYPATVLYECNTGLYPATATFACNDGFQLTAPSGASYSVALGSGYSASCAQNGTWPVESEMPSCVAVNCSDPGAPSNGVLSLAGNSYTFPAVATFTCNDGYSITAPSGASWSVSGLTATVTCTASGNVTSWPTDSHSPVCGGETCPDITAPGNGSVAFSPSNRTFPANVTYSCDAGYSLTAPNGASYNFTTTTYTDTCNATQNVTDWPTSSQIPTCQSMTCPDVTALSNGAISFNPTTRAFPATATFVCNGGYLVTAPGSASYSITDTSHTSSCSANTTDTWWPIESELPYCVPQTCPDTAAPTNANVTFSPSNRTFPANLTYTCNLGYVASAPTGATYSVAAGVYEVSDSCNGTLNVTGWEKDGEKPECTGDTCPTVSAPSNGAVAFSPTTRAYPSNVTFTCNDGYNLTASGSTYTVSGGTMSAPCDVFSNRTLYWPIGTEMPTCEPVACPTGDLPTLGNGTVTTSNSGIYPSTATFTCNDGYQISPGGGSSVGVACQANGTATSWANETGSAFINCSAVECPNTLTKDIYGTLVYSPTTRLYPATATWACNDGYELTAAANATLYNVTGSSVTDNCTATGTTTSWTFFGQQPFCNGTQCDGSVLAAPGNGSLTYTPTTRVFPANATFACDNGYQLTPPSGASYNVSSDNTYSEACNASGVASGTYSDTCAATGPVTSWPVNGSEPTCERSSCNAATDPNTATPPNQLSPNTTGITGKTYDNETFRFTCNDGYALGFVVNTNDTFYDTLMNCAPVAPASSQWAFASYTPSCNDVAYCSAVNDAGPNTLPANVNTEFVDSLPEGSAVDLRDGVVATTKTYWKDGVTLATDGTVRIEYEGTFTDNVDGANVEVHYSSENGTTFADSFATVTTIVTSSVASSSLHRKHAGDRHGARRLRRLNQLANLWALPDALPSTQRESFLPFPSLFRELPDLRGRLPNRKGSVKGRSLSVSRARQALPVPAFEYRGAARRGVSSSTEKCPSSSFSSSKERALSSGRRRGRELVARGFDPTPLSPFAGLPRPARRPRRLQPCDKCPDNYRIQVAIVVGASVGLMIAALVYRVTYSPAEISEATGVPEEVFEFRIEVGAIEGPWRLFAASMFTLEEMVNLSEEDLLRGRRKMKKLYSKRLWRLYRYNFDESVRHFSLSRLANVTPSMDVGGPSKNLLVSQHTAALYVFAPESAAVFCMMFLMLISIMMFDLMDRAFRCYSSRSLVDTVSLESVTGDYKGIYLSVYNADRVLKPRTGTQVQLTRAILVKKLVLMREIEKVLHNWRAYRYFFVQGVAKRPQKQKTWLCRKRLAWTLQDFAITPPPRGVEFLIRFALMLRKELNTKERLAQRALEDDHPIEFKSFAFDLVDLSEYADEENEDSFDALAEADSKEKDMEEGKERKGSVDKGSSGRGRGSVHESVLGAAAVTPAVVRGGSRRQRDEFDDDEDSDGIWEARRSSAEATAAGYRDSVTMVDQLSDNNSLISLGLEMDLLFTGGKETLGTNTPRDRQSPSRFSQSRGGSAAARANLAKARTSRLRDTFIEAQKKRDSAEERRQSQGSQTRENRDNIFIPGRGRSKRGMGSGSESRADSDVPSPSRRAPEMMEEAAHGAPPYRNGSVIDVSFTSSSQGSIQVPDVAALGYIHSNSDSDLQESGPTPAAAPSRWGGRRAEGEDRMERQRGNEYEGHADAGAGPRSRPTAAEDHYVGSARSMDGPNGVELGSAPPDDNSEECPVSPLPFQIRGGGATGERGSAASVVVKESEEDGRRSSSSSSSQSKEGERGRLQEEQIAEAARRYRVDKEDDFDEDEEEEKNDDDEFGGSLGGNSQESFEGSLGGDEEYRAKVAAEDAAAEEEARADRADVEGQDPYGSESSIGSCWKHVQVDLLTTLAIEDALIWLVHGCFA
uniref:Sushi domain-containing protein n=1 Tax=Chromera velia CCMP2878 TaxID=1169474 RepID=A0A0G4HE44_9ALVE|eukprot:Cvel_6513.t1-p1 / transcript=Cvel_6513.t1 / gene=Cvel_6513 / organism=Chromera_velia_CCMP2878 / gene_product=CUB and sushi domain-containing protein 3, putative / transcript_product=CUB and sushi domain-containing protein 3, putative / location=Cvel_scaffold320:12215-49609(-) / protein_length=1997 / sequence_SO=supercontig / SO=protein_coding / is_pseudo=false